MREEEGAHDGRMMQLAPEQRSHMAKYLKSHSGRSLSYSPWSMDLYAFGSNKEAVPRPLFG